MQYITGFCRGFIDYVRCRDQVTANVTTGWRHGRATAHFISGGY